ncbi:MAG: type VI secretion system baseplate subunit TssK [Gemmatimonadota bacterium]|nr:type VI secretion system baseplate subunit TssK [Gemmatimonadota bacterium]
MRSLRPIVWREGMHLAHHHFQQRDRYFEDSSTFALASVVFKPYGFTRLELDADALANGTAKVVHAAGVMPDGLVFSFPEEDAPPPLEVRSHFSPTSQRQTLWLAIPSYRADRANCERDGGGSRTRYVERQVEVADETTGIDEKRIAVARKNFSLALEEPEEGGVVALPIATVMRDHAGTFVYDPEFVPPTLHIGASRRLMELVHRLVEELAAKAATLGAERNGSPDPAASAPDEIVSYWLSHAVQSAIAPLQHHLRARTTHPEDLYRELLRLSGALCTFALDARADGFPPYDHDDPGPAFDTLERHIRSHLRTVLPKGALRVELEPLHAESDDGTMEPVPFFYSGDVPDPRCFEDASWFLEALPEGSHARAISDVPRLVKVCAAKHIVRLVQNAHPGMALEHLPSAPSRISPRPAGEYFRIETTGPCWESMRKAVAKNEPVAVGLYVPEALGDVKLTVLIAQG